jgi:hypothetical protein
MDWQTNFINIKMSKKKKFSEQEALAYCFNLISQLYKNEPKQYALFNTYRLRWKKGTLGEKGKDKVLRHYGFTLLEKIYRKDE